MNNNLIIRKMYVNIYMNQAEKKKQTSIMSAVQHRRNEELLPVWLLYCCRADYLACRCEKCLTGRVSFQRQMQLKISFSFLLLCYQLYIQTHKLVCCWGQVFPQLQSPEHLLCFPIKSPKNVYQKEYSTSVQVTWLTFCKEEKSLT